MWINLSDKEVDELLLFFDDHGYDQKLIDKLKEEQQRLKTKDHEELLEKAREQYGCEGNAREIQLDDDAAISEADEHDFVMAWVMVKHEDAKDVDESEDT